ncbi:MAG TPA: DNA repair protein RecN, partial [Treponema sp.]|nr:DNA repair protein RecN [Treponema sp.]
MLEELDIKNFALIDSAHLEFEKGFTVLSGETGAGKSILIGSLAFLLGGKAGVEQIRSGTTEAQVSGVFFLENKEAFEWLSEHGIESEENRILLRRIIRDSGKSSAWIGGVPVTKADLLSFSSFLVDIHGQHEQQSLMKVSEHRR